MVYTVEGRRRAETYNFAKTPLNAAQLPLAMARRSQTGCLRSRLLIVGTGVGLRLTEISVLSWPEAGPSIWTRCLAASSRLPLRLRCCSMALLGKRGGKGALFTLSGEGPRMWPLEQSGGRLEMLEPAVVKIAGMGGRHWYGARWV